MTINPEDPNSDKGENAGRKHDDNVFIGGSDDDFSVEAIVSHHMDHEDEVEDDGIIDASSDDEAGDSGDDEKAEKEYSPLDDDEQWLASDDTVLAEDDDSALIKQDDGAVIWRIQGLFDDKGKTHNQFYLRENPPIMIIEGSNGEYASLVMTKGFTRTMSTALGDLRKAYYGVSRKRGEERTVYQKVKKAPDWAMENKGKAAVLVSLTLALIVLVVMTGFSN